MTTALHELTDEAPILPPVPRQPTDTIRDLTRTSVINVGGQIVHLEDGRAVAILDPTDAATLLGKYATALAAATASQAHPQAQPEPAEGGGRS